MIEIKIVEENELETGFQLIWRVFQEYVALDCQKNGINTFYQEFIKNPKFHEKFKDGRETMYGAYIDKKLVGVLSIGKTHISCVFVDGRYHRTGIGRELFQTVIKELKKNGLREIKLNASPYAVEFYHKMGFHDIGKATEYQGIVYTPMKILV